MTHDDRTPDPPPPPADADPASDDVSLAATLEDFLALVKSGRRPSREEFLAGHGPNGAELSDCLEGLEMVLAATPQLPPPRPVGHTEGDPVEHGDDDGGGPLAPGGRLGDYRVVREVGRGGMGVVYEAEQLSLGRRVALKVLPFAASLDPKQRQRFQLEAQAAAHLQHPHIVPVYAVGRDRGIHYYAMQFIEGRSLAAAVREMREGAGLDALASTEPRPTGHTPPPRPAGGSGSGPGVGASGQATTRGAGFYHTVARLGAQAAEALEHAHALGVIHRDVKPANLLIDPRGDLWVTDFGLARFLDDPGPTRTGDLLGTLAYMSPEQALGRREVDHRADIYSLGATLYELLVRRPPFEGRDRHDLLRKIAHDDPARLRRLDPAVPRDLETVVLKAMEKEPSGRYATAQELAEELGRFLRDEPVRARPPGPVEKAAKWARRHRAVVVTALTVLVIAMGVGTALMLREQQRTEQARQDLRRNFLTMVNMADVVTLRAMGLASNNQTAGVMSGDSRPMVQGLFEKALEFYVTAARQPESDYEMRALVAHANHRIGFIRLMRKLEGGEEAFRLSVAQHQSLIADAPDVASYRLSLAYTLNDWALLLAEARGLDAAEPTYRQAMTIRREVALRFPVDPEDLANYLLYEADWASNLDARDRHEEAAAVRDRVLAFGRDLSLHLRHGPAQHDAMTRTIVAQGKLLIDKERRRDAETFFRFALLLSPGHDVATNNLAWVLVTRPGTRPYDPEQAVQLAEEAISANAALEPGPNTGILWNTLGVARYRTGDAGGAEDALRMSMDLRGGGDPNDWLFLAMIRAESGDLPGAKAWYDRSQAWMARNPSRAYDTDLQAFLREAGTRLGLKEPPTPEERVTSGGGVEAIEPVIHTVRTPVSGPS